MPIVNNAVNAVAMTVLPGAPSDPVTGLKVPTIAVATAGGISVIKHNGTVVNSSSTAPFFAVLFDGSGLWSTINSASSHIYFYGNAGLLSSGFVPAQSDTSGTAPDFQRISSGYPTRTGRCKLASRTINTTLVSSLKASEANLAKGIGNQITATFNTGHMVGDIRRCFLSDVTTGSVTGPELMTNGTFESSNGWVLDTGWSISGGALVCTSGKDNQAICNIPVSSTKIYSITFTYTATFGYFFFGLGGISSPYYSRRIGSGYTANGTYTLLVQAVPSSANVLYVYPDNSFTGTIDNISVREVIPDRSYKAAGANIYGTLTASAVNTGNSLVAYSGFSGSNYLREEFSSDLEFGTGEWSVGAWVTIPTGNAAAGTIACREHSSGAYIRLGIDATNKLTATAFDGTTTRTVTTTAAYNTATWTKARATYTTDGTLAIMVNGVSVASTTGAPLLSLNSRYNLLNFSEQFDNAAWSKNLASITPNATTAPDGTTTADTFTVTSLGSASVGVNTIAGTGAGNYTFSFSAKALDSQWIRANITSRDVWFDIVNGVVGTNSGSGALLSATITSQDNGWFRVVFSSTQAFAAVAITNVSGDGSSTRMLTSTYLWGAQLELGSVAKTYQRTTTVAETEVAPLTIGNSYALDAPFPGSIALVKLSATVPTAEQTTWMYEQEKQLFANNAQCVLPSSTNVLDLAYDDKTDTWIATQAEYESTWNGLVRTSATPVPAGSFSKTTAASGIKLSARTTTNPGVDVSYANTNIYAVNTIPDNKEVIVFNYDTIGFSANTVSGNTTLTSVTVTAGTPYVDMKITGTGIPTDTVITGINSNNYYISNAATVTSANTTALYQADYTLPANYSTIAVYSNGVLKREGSTKDYTKLYDGFKETIRFGTSPGANAWVQIYATKG